MSVCMCENVYSGLREKDQRACASGSAMARNTGINPGRASHIAQRHTPTITVAAGTRHIFTHAGAHDRVSLHLSSGRPGGGRIVLVRRRRRPQSSFSASEPQALGLTAQPPPATGDRTGWNRATAAVSAAGPAGGRSAG